MNEIEPTENFILIDDTTIDRLRSERITVLGPIGENNRVILSSPLPPDCNVKLRLNNFNNSLIKIGECSKINIDLFVVGNNTKFSLGDSTLSLNAQVFLYNERAEVKIGKMCSANSISLVSWGEGGKIFIGDHCMFSFDIWIRASDEHAIIDFSGQGCRQTNLPRDIIIGHGVWIGQDALILKGSKINRGSIVGAKSVVSGNVPEFALAAGIPATVMRTGVTWSRSSLPNAEQMEQEVRLKTSM